MSPHTLSFLRRARDADDVIVLACNFTPVPRSGYRIGVPHAGRWQELLNSDASDYGGSGTGNLGGVASDAIAWHGHPQSIAITLPPLGIVVFKPERDTPATPA